MSAEVSWLTGFLDMPASTCAAGTEFWAAATGTTPSPWRGEAGEFATLLPPDGDACWRVQRLSTGGPLLHLDVHTPDRTGVVGVVSARGAVVLDVLDDVTVLRSPGGLHFCVVDDAGSSTRNAPVDWGTHSSMLDQVCLDVPEAAWETEVAFWSQLLAEQPSLSTRRPEFTNLPRPAQLPLRLLFQLVGGDGEVGAHPDLASTDREAEVDRLVGLGAEVVTVEQFWTVLRAPDTRLFCVTERDPATGQLN